MGDVDWLNLVENATFYDTIGNSSPWSRFVIKQCNFMIYQLHKSKIQKWPKQTFKQLIGRIFLGVEWTLKRLSDSNLPTPIK